MGLCYSTGVHQFEAIQQAEDEKADLNMWVFFLGFCMKPNYVSGREIHASGRCDITPALLPGFTVKFQHFQGVFTLLHHYSLEAITVQMK